MLKYIVSVIISMAFVTSASAGQYCPNEKITFLMLGNDFVNFRTDKSCLEGCKIDTSWPQNTANRAYSLLLSAQAQKIGLTFYWAEHTTPCQGSVPDGGSPVFIAFSE